MSQGRPLSTIYLSETLVGARKMWLDLIKERTTEKETQILSSVCSAGS